MKNKFLTFILSVCLIVPCFAVFSACDDSITYVKSAEELRSALTSSENKKVVLDDDIELDAKLDENQKLGGVYIKGVKTLDLNNHKITLTDAVDYVFMVSGELTINGGGDIDMISYPNSHQIELNEDGIGVWAVDGGKVNITGGNFLTDSHAVYVQKGEAKIYNGTFNANAYIAGKNYFYTINCLDANYSSGNAKIKIYGGTYYKQNPAESPSEPNAPVNFLAEGYISKLKDGETNVYIVQKQND